MISIVFPTLECERPRAQHRRCAHIRAPSSHPSSNFPTQSHRRPPRPALTPRRHAVSPEFPRAHRRRCAHKPVPPFLYRGAPPSQRAPKEYGHEPASNRPPRLPLPRWRKGGARGVGERTSNRARSGSSPRHNRAATHHRPPPIGPRLRDATRNPRSRRAFTQTSVLTPSHFFASLTPSHSPKPSLQPHPHPLPRRRAPRWHDRTGNKALDPRSPRHHPLTPSPPRDRRTHRRRIAPRALPPRRRSLPRDPHPHHHHRPRSRRRSQVPRNPTPRRRRPPPRQVKGCHCRRLGVGSAKTHHHAQAARVVPTRPTRRTRSRPLSPPAGRGPLRRRRSRCGDCGYLDETNVRTPLTPPRSCSARPPLPVARRGEVRSVPLAHAYR